MLADGASCAGRGVPKGTELTSSDLALLSNSTMIYCAFLRRLSPTLLACCPLVPVSVVGVLLGHRQAVTTAQLLARLRRAGLAHYQAFRLGPLLGSRPVRLWTLTAAGHAVVAEQARYACRSQAEVSCLTESLNVGASRPANATFRCSSPATDYSPKWPTALISQCACVPVCLSPVFQSAWAYDNWLAGYRNTRSVELPTLTANYVAGNTAQVVVAIRTVDVDGSRSVTKRFQGTWDLVRINGAWRLDQGKIAEVP